MNGSAEGKRKYITEAVKVIDESPSDAEKEELLRVVSKETGISYQAIKRDMDKAGENKDKTQKAPDIAQNQQIQRSASSSAVQAERFILARILWKKRPLPNDFMFDSVRFTDEHRVEMAGYLKDFIKQGLEVKTSLLYDYMGEEGRTEAEEVLMLLTSELMENDTEDKFLKDCVRLLKKEEAEEKIKELTSRASNEPDLEKRKAILRELQVAIASSKKI